MQKKDLQCVAEFSVVSVPMRTQPYTIPKAGLTHTLTPGGRGCRAVMLGFNKCMGEQ